ncbi:MAG: tetratricopeptide repeat protein [Myxococcota bacterium]|nr:tetratricopeptide repeat protein [Myxococcota bacterium]
MPETPRNPASLDPTNTAGKRARPLRTVAALLVALATLPYLNALGAGFVYDDSPLVRKHSAVQAPFDLARVLGTSYWDTREDTRLWRPFVTLSFAVDDAIANDSARTMHAVNLFVHTIVTLLAWTFVRRLGGSSAAAFASAALFAVHPLHTEAVTWISGRAELFAALGVFVAALAALRGGALALATCAAATFFAVASKESAATLPLFIAALALLGPPDRRSPWAASLVSCGALLVYLGFRFAVLGTLAGPDVTGNENAMVGTGAIDRLPTVLDAAGRYVALLVWPRVLAIDYGPPVLGLASNITGYGILGTAAALGLVATAALRRNTRLAIAAVFALLFYAVASNLLIVIGTNFAERLFYLPSFGLLWIVAEVAARAAQRSQAANIALTCVLTILLGAGAVRTFVRNTDYRDDLSLADAALAVHPNSKKMLYNRARALGNMGRHAEAISAAQEALAANANPTWTPVVLANALVALDRKDEAESTLRAVLKEDPRKLATRQRWMQLLDARGDSAAADVLAEAALDLGTLPADPGAATVFWARGARAAQSRGELELAIARWNNALELAPGSAEGWTQLGLSLFGQKRSDQARAALEHALELDPDASRAANALAWLLVDAGELDQAVGLARRAVAADASPENRDTYARALEARGDCAAAIEQAELAAEATDPEFKQRRDELVERCHPDEANADKKSAER